MLWKKILILFTLITSLSFQVLAATAPDAFYVSVNPNPLKPNEAVDMTVKAVQADGTVVSDYVGTVIMELDGYPDPNTYDMPNNGIYQFTAQDQWSKTFSKWLVIKKSWTYKLNVITTDDESIIGSVDLVVWSGNQISSGNQKLIQILSPISGTTVEASAINIVGKSDVKRAPLQFFVDDKKIETEGETDENGNFWLYLTNIEQWNRTIVVKTVDYQGNVLWESESLSLVYKAPIVDQYLKSFTVTPSGKINAWDTVVIDAQVDGSVRSVELRVGDMWLYPMERKSDGTFTKSLLVDTAWVQQIDATLIFEWWQRTVYTDRATLDVAMVNGIGPVKIVNDVADPQKVNVSWTPIGSPAAYLIRYGQSKDNLSSEIKSSTPSVTIPQLEVGKEYFFQVYATDSAWLVSGKWSDIASLTIKWQNAAWIEWWSSLSTCTIVGIKVRSQKINDEYFLIWDAVPGATSYSVYRSDFVVNSIDQMQKVWDTSVPQFAYPFDATAQQDQYAYYSVTANCADGNTLQIDNIKKIHVWPISDMITILVICLFCYSLYRLYKFA